MLQASVIVPARDAAPTLRRTLDALAEQDFSGEFEVIVVNDGSSDSTAAMASSARAPVRLLEQPPSGPAAARNLGVRASGAPVLAFCDADVFPAPGWLSAGMAALAQADLVQGKVLPDPQATLGPFDRSLWITGQPLLWETASLFVTRDLFERAGGFEEWIVPRLGKALAEDVWFGYRALRLGARAVFCPEALAHHAVFSRTWAEYVAERTRLVYFPALSAKMPELREDFLYRGVFLNPRSARLDLGAAGGLAALLLGSPLPLVAALPYLRALRTHARRAAPAAPHSGATVAAADLAADLVGLAALVCGSLRYRALVL